MKRQTNPNHRVQRVKGRVKNGGLTRSGKGSGMLGKGRTLGGTQVGIPSWLLLFVLPPSPNLNKEEDRGSMILHDITC